MQLVGNFFLFLATLAIGVLFYLTFVSKSSGGDASYGTAYATMYVAIAFGLSLVLVACILGFGGGFAWLSLGRFGSGGMLLICFLVILFGLFGLEARTFRSIPYLAPIIAVTTLFVVMASFAVLLNENLKMIVSPTVVKWGLVGVLAVNSLVLVTIVIGAIASRVSAFLPGSSDKLDDIELSSLVEIDSCDVSKGIAHLFNYCGDNKHQQIREKALLKIKSKPNWQDDLYNALEDNNVEGAFSFLLANDVDDKPRFAKGVYQGVLSQARLIREGLRRCWHQSHLHDGKFGYELRRTLAVVEKFKDLGVDFKPAVMELRAALDEPIQYDNPDPSDKKMLDRWLRKH